MATRLGPLEMRLFANSQLRGARIVRRDTLATELRLTPARTAALLGRMARARLIARVRPGVYLVPERLPLGGMWSPDEALALDTLMKEHGARYQVCGPNAFNRYGLDSQIPNRLYVYNDQLSGERRIGSVVLTLIKVDASRLGGAVNVNDADGIQTPYSSRARTLVDALHDWSRFDGLPRGYGWIRSELASGRVKPAELVTSAARWGDVATRRRLGALLEREGVPERLLGKLSRTLRTTQSTIPWDPTRKKRGVVDRRWGVVWNEGT